MKVDPDDWPIVSRLMDEWLALPPDRREEWLANLGPEHSHRMPALRQLLAQPKPEFLQTLPGAEDDATEPIDDSPAALREGTPIGPYVLTRELGHGGMGVVWLAARSDGAMQREVAIKFPHAYLHTLAGRFAREREILARLTDARIARLYDAGATTFGQPYLVLEYVEGEPITSFCDRLRMNIPERLRLFQEVLRGVQYAHTNLIVHRDLKPSNILVTKAGEIRLLDFGIAKLLEEGEAQETEITRLGGRALTPDFASPEQLAGGAITTTSDVYSLGILLYELMTGERPYKLSRDATAGMAETLLKTDPVRPSQSVKDDSKAAARAFTAKRLAGALRGDLDTIVLKAIQKEPSQRYSTADAFAQDIERYLTGQPLLARPESAWYRTRKFVARNRLAVAAAAAVIVALAGGAGIALWQKRRADMEAATARAVSEFLQKDLLAQAGANGQAEPGRRPDPDLKVRTALDRAAARIGTRFGAEPAVEAAIRETIATSYLNLGLFAEAQQHMERTVELRKRALGADHPDTLTGMVDLAEILRVQGKYAPAEALFKRALDADERLKREDDPSTAGARNGLAMLAINPHGDLKRAEELYTRNLETNHRVLGDSAPLTLATMNNLGALLLREGKYAKAEELLKRVVDIKRRVMGEEHPSTLTSIGGLSTVYRNLGRYAEAESLLTNLVEVRRRVSGPRHRDTLSTMNALGNTYLAEAKYDQADAQFASVLEMERQALGEQSPETLTTLFNQAELRFRQNRLDQAQQLLEQVLNLGRAAGPNAVLMRGAQSALGRVKLQQRSFEQAEALLRPALEAYRKSDFDSWSRYAVECELGASLAGMGRHDEAEKLLAEGYPELVKRRDTIPQDYRTILDEARHWAESEGR